MTQPMRNRVFVNRPYPKVTVTKVSKREQVFAYLQDLREMKVYNLFGAHELVMRKFNMSKNAAALLTKDFITINNI